MWYVKRMQGAGYRISYRNGLLARLPIQDKKRILWMSYCIGKRMRPDTC
jgi:hypothetical protein